jgi:hypothetical protein
MGIKISPEVRAAMTEIARKFGRKGGKAAAKNMTPAERSARAKKASEAAAKNRTAARLERLERLERTAKSPKKVQGESEARVGPR